MMEYFKIFLMTVTANMLHESHGFGADCTPGKLLEGPTCSSFYKCIEERYFKGIMKFDCPPGTYFNLKKSLCIHDTNGQCPSSGPQPPAPFPVFGGSQVDHKPPGTVVRPPGPPSRPVSNFPPAIDDNTTCVNYEIDNSGVYDCISPGLIPSYGDCTKFYICINTMGCIVKGYYVNCPENYIYDSTEEICVEESKSGPCPYLQDSVETIHVLPIIALNPENVDDFFKASAYWHYMPFLPTVNQRIVGIIPTPGDVARGSSSENKIAVSESKE